MSFLQVAKHLMGGLAEPRVQQWRAVQSGTIRINFDRAVFSSGEEIRIIVVARENEGIVLAWVGERRRRWGGPGLAEVQVAKEAVRLDVNMVVVAKECGLHSP
ncbi:hypothetical protein Salat_0186700 [Sesamum alatum]|uniref:Uncharacterized protein n=1 Tax=Sesamum alatum TaxID=300844 RepID=A0AAE1YZB6_9LAMI|nr:hypothetical protein Salat_0186700 [Sesamum alatum]